MTATCVDHVFYASPHGAVVQPRRSDDLVAGGVGLAAPTFFSWLGVTMYVTEAAIDAVLKTVAAFERGSEIVFTYPRREPVERDPADGPSLAELAAAMGEPWLSYVDAEELERKLGSLRFANMYFASRRCAPALLRQQD